MRKWPDNFINQIICGDAKDILQEIPNDSIDLVFTDPPYPKKYQHCFQYLADYCPRIMKHGASLMTLLGHYQLETVMLMFHGKLKYRWIIDLDQFESSHARMAMGVEVVWKPMLWYVKGSYPSGRGFLVDGIKSSAPNKSLHKWQQSTEWAEYYIKKLTKEGDVVLDPYFGSGTVGEVCKNLNRYYIGIDIDEMACKTAQERMSQNKV